MKTRHQPVKESQPVQHYIIPQQLLISLIGILESRGSIKTEGQVEAEGVSVVNFKLKQTLWTEDIKKKKAIPFWLLERFHTWQPLTDLSANLFF